jgi:zinc D-Ala-D-Ala dipeptidase
MRRAAALLLALACDGGPAGVHEPGPTPVAADPPARSAAPIAAASARAESPPHAPPLGFVDLRHALAGACFHIGYATADNFTGAPLPGYGAAGAWLREAPADALARAAAALADQQLRLVVFDAYRPRRASVAMVAWARANGRTDLLRDGWVAARSGHNRGLAIDVGLCDAEGKLLEMGSAWDHFGPESHANAATGVAATRRAALRGAMVAAGFSPYALEWWHFSFTASGAAELDVPYGPSEPQ